MRLFSDTQESVGKLLEEAGEYASLCRRYTQKRLAEKVTALLSAVIVAVALFVVGGIALMLLLFALAYLAGELLGSVWLGFACVTAVALLLFLVVYRCCGRWIVARVARHVNDEICATADELTADELEREMRLRRELVMAHLNALSGRTAATAGKAHRMSRAVYHAVSLYNGFKVGIAAMSMLRGLFGKTRRGKGK